MLEYFTFVLYTNFDLMAIIMIAIRPVYLSRDLSKLANF